MSQLWNRVTDSRPLTWQAYVFLSLGLIILSPSILTLATTGTGPAWRLVFVVSLVAEGALVYFPGMLILGRRKIRDNPLLAWSIVLCATAGFPILFRITVDVLLPSLDFHPGAFRFFTTGLLWFLGIMTFAVAVNETRQFQTEMSELHAQLVRLQQLEEQETTALESLRLEIFDEVRRTLSKAFATLSRQPQGTNLATELHTLIDDVVRPLSSELANKEPSQMLSGRFPETGRIPTLSLRMVFRRLASENPFGSVVMPVAVGVSTFVMKTWVVSVETAITSALLTMLVTGACLWILKKVYPLIRGRMSQGARLWIVVVSFTAVSLTDAAIARNMMGLPPSLFVLQIAFTQFSVLLILAMLRVVPAERQRLLEELQDAINRVNWMTTRLGQEIWVEQSRLARLVHGDIQARIMATALHLDLRHASSDQIDIQLIELQHNCDDALLRPAQNQPIKIFIDALSAMWSASVCVRNELSVPLMDLVEQDPIAKDAIAEIIRESVNNAVKHSGATHITLCAVSNSLESLPEERTSQNGPHQLILEIVSRRDAKNGRKKSREKGPEQTVSGRGSQIFDQLCSRWELMVSETGSVLRAELPLRVMTPKSTLG